jgi:hypothetical protein
LQHGDLRHPHRNCTTAEENPDPSYHTSDVAADHYTSPYATNDQPGRMMMRPQDDIECEATRQWGELTDEREGVEARLANLHQHESVPEVGHVERQLPTFARASQNVVALAALLDTLLAPSTDAVVEVY